jgi:hypothetical protein
MLREANYEVIDFGDLKLNPDDDYPDFVVPLARAVAGLRWIAVLPSVAVVSVRALPPTRWRCTRLPDS